MLTQNDFNHAIALLSGLSAQDLAMVQADGRKYLCPVKQSTVTASTVIAPAGVDEAIQLLAFDAQAGFPAPNLVNSKSPQNLLVKSPLGHAIVKYTGADPVLGADLMGTSGTFGCVTFTANSLTPVIVHEFNATTKVAVITFVV